MGTRRASRYSDYAAPAMEYQSASGLWLPVGGTPGTGKSPIIQADGSVQWQTPSGGGGSLDVQDEGSTVVAGAATLDFRGDGVLVTNVSGVARATIPGATAGKVLAYAFSNTTSGPTADSASDVQVPDLLTASFTLAAATDVKIFGSIRASKSTGYIVLSIYDNGVKLAPLAGGGAAPPPNAWYAPGQVNGGERQNQQGWTPMIINLAAGSHQIAIYHAASANLNAITWYERFVEVIQMA